ncbi:MAG: DeoR/GlpR transcriptional regulator [Phycisphaerae bacterium]|nr:DeoR/GlpR transcriptional regulator [Phycisphaerae bacterium]
MGKSTKQRRQAILADVYRLGRVSIREMAVSLEISEATARRDLQDLARYGKVELVHGGATLPHKGDFSFHSKGMRNVEAKRIVGQLAADCVNDGDLIFLDSGTTCFQMAPYIQSKRSVSIIVNSARLALELESADLNVILLGGQYRPERMDTVGPMTIAALDQLRGFTAFVGTDGLSMDFGPTANDIESAYVYRKAIANSRESILLADHSKFLNPSLFKIDGFEAISKIITDQRPSDEWMRFLKGLQIKVVYPKDQDLSCAEEASNVTTN